MQFVIRYSQFAISFRIPPGSPARVSFSNMESGSADAPWTVARLLTWTKDFLEQRRIESPRLCAEILLAHVLKCERLRLFTQYERVPEADLLAAFRNAVKEAATGRPIAYIVGRKDFFSMTFEVSPAVLIPRPETELLVERVIAAARARSAAEPPAILDIGCGSGCIAIAIARHLPTATVAACDVSPEALAIARRNAELHAVASRIDFRLGDVYAPWRAENAAAPRFDFIVSNPPYIGTSAADRVAASVIRFEPHAALFAGHDGTEILRRIVDGAAEFLKPGGELFLEVGEDQAGQVQAWFDRSAWPETARIKDHGGLERVVTARLGPLAKLQVA